MSEVVRWILKRSMLKTQYPISDLKINMMEMYKEKLKRKIK